MSDSFSSKIKEFTAALEKIPNSEKNAESLTKIISSIIASQNILRELGSKGMVTEVNQYIQNLERLMTAIENVAKRGYGLKSKFKELSKINKFYKSRASLSSIDPDIASDNEFIRDLDEDELAKYNRMRIKEDREAIRKKREKDFAEQRSEYVFLGYIKQNVQTYKTERS